MQSYSREISYDFPKSRRIAVMLAAAILAGCDIGPVAHVQALENAMLQPAEAQVQPAPPAWYQGELPILRFEPDRGRERGWILTRMGVQVLDFKTRQTTGYLPLPDWVWAGAEFSCPPDLALGPNGEAIISSNVMSTLWRVDPQTLAVSKHEVALDADTDKDVGFTGLAYSAKDNAIFAVSEFGALWRIDPLLREARKIPLSAPIPKACRVAIRSTVSRLSFGLCVHGQRGDWTVNFTHDRRSGYVFAQPCAAVQPPGLADGGQPAQTSDLMSLAAATFRR
jgi:hypothetical protein